MRFINGINENASDKINISSFWKQLPNPPDKQIIEDVEQKVQLMQKRFRLFTEKNQILSIIAQLNSLLNAKQDEIERTI